MMRIVTNYTVQPSQGEVCTDPSVTDGSQYMSVSEALQRYIRGENLDMHDYTRDNPMDCKEKFDILDLAIDQDRLHKKPDEEPGEKPAEEPGEKPAEKPAEEPGEKPAENT